MKKTSLLMASVIALTLIFTTIWAFGNMGDAVSEAPPEYLPLPERATAELRSLGISLPSEFNYSPSLEIINPPHINVPQKIRLTTHDVISEKSAIWDIDVEAVLMKSPGYGIHFRVILDNITDTTITVQDIQVIWNPQLEYHYSTPQTFRTSARDQSIIYPLNEDGRTFGMGFGNWFPLLGNNPFHLSAEILKERFNIFFRELYIITEWDGNREVVLVNVDDIEFRKEIDDETDSAN